MRRLARLTAAFVLVAGIIVLTVSSGDAHKPITSPYTYNEDVYPLLRDRCGRCHVSGGVAPMSLLTHADTVPWGESIRTELLAGQMPPWSVDSAPGRFRNVEGITAREMNVILTWATGGAPLGDPEKSPAPATVENTWRLGPPDLTLQMPVPFTVKADARESRVDITLATHTTEPRFVKAVDILPGTPAIVRAAIVAVRSATPTDGPHSERVLAVWLPGDKPVALDEGSVFELPAGAELVLSVLYRKTWEYERKEMTDQSSVGVYFASGPRPIVQAITMTSPAIQNASLEPTSFSQTIDQDIRALALYARTGLTNRRVKVMATRPGGARTELIAFHPRPDWARRYWFQEPIDLPRGTRLDVTATVDDEMSPLSAAPSATPATESTSLSIVLNAVPPP